MHFRINAAASSTADSDPFDRVTEDNTEYLVAPVVAQQEDVYRYRLNGETQREYLPGDELTAPLDAWEGVPLVLRHPDAPDGQPALLSESGVSGTVVGGFRDVERTNGGDRLAGRVYIRVNELDRHDGDLRGYVERVRRTGVGEVSTGYDVGRLEQSTGRHNGQRYTHVQRDITPDHLALLPDHAGNCPVDGGVCGVGRANAHARTNHYRAHAKHGEMEPTDIPDEYIFQNPGQATGKAEEMGLDGGDIHEQETDDGQVFMPGASHASLLAHLRDEGVIDDPARENAKHGDTGEDDDRMNADVNVGDKVAWSTSGRNWYGIVREVRSDDDAAAFDSEIDGDATVDPPAALIEEYLPADDVDGGGRSTKNGWTKTGTMVAHSLATDTLSVVDAFPRPGRVNVTPLAADDPARVGEDWPVADATRANQTPYEVTNVTADAVDEWTDAEWDGDAATAAMPNPSESDAAPDALDAAHLLVPADADARDDKATWKLPFREGPDAPANTRALTAAIAAINGARGGIDDVSGDQLEAAYDRAVSLLVAAPEDRFGSLADADDAPTFEGRTNASAVDSLRQRVASVLGLADTRSAATTPPPNEATTPPARQWGVVATGRETTDTQPAHETPAAESTPDEPAESGATPDDPTQMQDADKIDTLVSDHGFDRENLEPLDGSDCLARIHERFAGDGTDDDDSDSGTDTEPTDDPMTDSDTDIETLVDERVEERVNDAIAEALDDEADAIAERVDEARQNEQHIQTVADSDTYPLGRDELETMAPDAVAKLADSVATESEADDGGRANFAGVPTGPSFEAGDVDPDDDAPSSVGGALSSLGGED